MVHCPTALQVSRGSIQQAFVDHRGRGKNEIHVISLPFSLPASGLGSAAGATVAGLRVALMPACRHMFRCPLAILYPA